MLRRRARAASLLTLGATLTALALVSTPTGAGATPPPNATERVSVSYDGGDANGWSNRPVISADGNVVLFGSLATNLVNGPGAVLNVRNLATGVTTPLTAAPTMGNAGLTGDGGKVVFDSPLANLVPGDTNGKSDVFLHDIAAGTIVRASVDSNGAQYPSGISTHAGVSDDGRYVAFVTTTVQTANCQNNRVSVRDLTTGKTKIVQRCVSDARLSGDGSALVAMTASTTLNCGYDLNHVELATGVSTPIGCGTEPSISGNGDVVAFKAWGGDGRNGMRAFDVRSGVYDRIDVNDAGTASNGALGLVTAGPVLNGNGRIAVFAANADNLVPGDGATADVFVRDLTAGTTRMVSVATDGTPGEQESIEPDISADGSMITFTSRARDLVAGTDNNNQPDVFVRHVAPSVSTCGGATPTITGTPGNDVLTGTPGNDVIDGLGGHDWISGLGGNDLVCGGGGQDIVDFTNAPGPVDMDLALGTATGEGADTLVGIEGAVGSGFNDKLKGSAQVDVLHGEGGADAVSGFGSNDIVDGGPGNDKLYGHTGRDTLMGGPGSDLLSGGADSDILFGGDGIDTCSGDATDSPVTECEG